MAPLFVAPPATLPPTMAMEAATAVVVHAHPAPYGWTRHTVRAGDTVYDLALRHHSTVSAIAAKNSLGPRRMIYVGQRVWVPRTTPARTSSGQRRHATRPRAAAHQTPRARAKRPAPTTHHTVRVGETLWGIAHRYRTTTTRLAKMNHLRTPGLLWVGARLTVPAPPRPPARSDSTFAGRTYSKAVVASAKRHRAHLAGAHVPSRSETKILIRRTARRHGVDPRLALAVAWQESGWNQRMVSVADAIGTMQVIPSSGEWASALVGRRLDLLDPQDNVTAGVVILRALTRNADSLDQAIAGYYQGLASVRAHGMYPDTRQYVATVRHLRKRI